jgi:outer membrane protein
MMKGKIGVVALGVGGIALAVATGAPAADGPAGPSSVLPPSTPGGLTADEVARRAKDTSPIALAQRQALVAAEARLDEALVAYYPRLTLIGRYTRLSPIEQPPISFGGGGAGGMGGMGGAGGAGNGSSAALVFPVYLNQYLLQAGLTIPLSDYILKTSHSYAAASHSVRAAKLDEGAARLQAAVNGRTLYYNWLRAVAQVTVSQRSLDNARGHLADARNSFEAGTVSKADVLAVESQVANAELVLARAQNVARVTEEQIRVAMHDTGMQPYAVGEDLGAEVTSPLLTANLGALTSDAFSRRLEIRALDANASAAKEQASAAKGSYYPSVSAFADLYAQQPNQRYFPPPAELKATWDVGAQITWSPNDALLGGGARAEAQARAAQIEAQKASIIDNVRLEVIQAYQAVQEAQIAIQTSTRGQIAAEEAYRVRRELFKNGRATSVELTDTEVQLITASLNSINARANLRAALAQLQHATGRDIPEGER